MKKRIAAFLLSLILLCNCGLDQNDFIEELLPEPTVTPVSSMSLSFHASKTLDPFGLTSALNLQIGKLVWEPLFARNADQSALPVLAAGLQQRDQLNWYVSLNTQRVFWDGSAITAKDVIFSYQKALQSSEYSHIKNSIASVTAEGDGVLVTLTRPNIYCYALLDFPIVKADDYPESESGQAQNSIPVVHYIGSGLYHPVYGNDRVSLQLNPRHPAAADANVKTVRLEDTPDFAAMNSAIATQLSDGGYSDLTGGLKPSVSGNVFGVAQNNMVYLGIVQKGAMVNVELRKAVSLALNRTLLNSFYSGYAVSAVTPFHPSFYAANSKSCANLTGNSKAAAQLLSTLGDAGRLKLIYSSQNPVSTELAAEITRQLTEAGLSIDCVGLSGSDYRAAVSHGSCDLYVGEVQLSGDYSYTALLSTQADAPASAVTTLPAIEVQKAVSSLSVSCSAELRRTLDSFLAGGEIDAFLTAFDAELPFIPLLYRSGMAAYAKKYDITPTAVFDNAFDGISKTTITTYPDPITTEDE